MAKVARLEKIWYRVDSDGQVTKDRDGTPNGEFTFKFKETGGEISRNIIGTHGLTQQIWDSIPNVYKCLTMHGIMQKCGDTAASPEADTEKVVTDKVIQVIDDGDFYAEREKGEPRASLLAEAVWQFKREKGFLSTVDGVEVATRSDGTTETLEDTRARLAGKDGAKARAKAQAEPRVAEIVRELRIAAEQAALAKLKEKAGTAPASTTNAADL